MAEWRPVLNATNLLTPLGGLLLLAQGNRELANIVTRMSYTVQSWCCKKTPMQQHYQNGDRYQCCCNARLTIGPLLDACWKTSSDLRSRLSNTKPDETRHGTSIQQSERFMTMSETRRLTSLQLESHKAFAVLGKAQNTSPPSRAASATACMTHHPPFRSAASIKYTMHLSQT